ncbi:MAG: Imidazole glycerol phosphate synthase subunit HisF [Spirochaetes bacterium ADurb.Bin315]|jgi:cyclase|nr:MAG: Imidazole glycerol phosphate synthase subunit HisF [Spirochaetes bacterium ADurb.Bin315]HOE88961.1 imidazole glycerol phosphate synthase subunit HisF [Sphaerochaeta sp.]HOR80627.1 imidazole glycerol phosphate synthase subunit HisF [Sphaerochaeta sp.]
MNRKRIIACLDVKDGRVVKGVNFVGLSDAGDPIGLARHYSELGIDELVLLDITATVEKRKTFIDLVRGVSEGISVPLTVGGGIASVEDAKALLEAGAAKVSINSMAVRDPSLIAAIANAVGSERLVVAIDAKEGRVAVQGGRVVTDRKVVDWAKEVERLGAGEILLTSMDHDGVKEGYDIALTKAVAAAVSIPVIASGGAGTMEHFARVFEETGVSGALGASVFHFGTIDIPKLKIFLAQRGITTSTGF